MTLCDWARNAEYIQVGGLHMELGNITVKELDDLKDLSVVGSVTELTRLFQSFTHRKLFY